MRGHPSRRAQKRAPQDEDRMRPQTLMVRSAATPRVSNHEAVGSPYALGRLSLENALTGWR
jgi:hypothetical protein